jgi:16S rRNA processing protein RimM
LSEFVTVGRVGRPHGLDGSVVVERPSENEELFAPGATLFADGREVKVADRKRSGGRLVLKLDPPVERGTELAIPRAALPEPEDGSFYVFQLIGLEVVEEGGRRLGTVKEVTPGLANDVLELDSGILLPMHAECVREVDLSAGTINVAAGFTD